MPGKRRWRSALLALVLSLPSAAADAQAAPRRKTALSLTVSGGVSFGAYEAGFLYYALETAKENPWLFDLRAVTGASAGSLNGLLSVLSACGPRVGSPEESLFWQTWIPLGFDQLFVPEETTRLGAFSQRSLHAAAGRVEAAWNQGLSPDCDVVLGITTTRVQPKPFRTAGERLELPRIEEKFALRLRGRGPGVPPLAMNYVDPADPIGAQMLVTDSEGRVSFPAIRDLVLASAAFPVAFPPQPLEHCTARPDAGARCLPSRAERTLFLDGGVLDNSPLRLATRLVGAGLRPAGGGLGWIDAPRMRSSEIPAGAFFALVSPQVAEYPEIPPPPGAEPTHSVADLLRTIATGFVNTARAKELDVLVEEHPDLAGHILLPLRHFPTASAPLVAFFGFFEREFRTFDFQLGMYEARRLLEDEVRPAASRGRRSEMVFPEADAGPAGGDGWRAFECLRAVIDGAGDPGAACAGERLRDFRVLLQASLDQLYDACSRGPADLVERAGNLHCRRAARGELPPLVPGVRPAAVGAWRRGASEEEVAYTVRLLTLHRFVFRDLGLGPDEGDRALWQIRRRLGRVVQQLADAQPLPEAQLVSMAGKLAADAVSYSPPERVFYLTMGPESEFGLSHRLSESRVGLAALRIGAALQMRGLADLLSSGDHPWSIAALGGVELQPPGFSTLALQPRIGVRGGFLFANKDRFGLLDCADPRTTVIAACSRPVVQGLLAVTLLERFRLQLTGEWYPPSPARAGLWSVTPGFGVEMPF